MRELWLWPKVRAMVRDPKKQAIQFGRWAETACRGVLLLTGWHVLEHGYRRSRGSGAGEIDLIARRANVLAFIEVKARSLADAGLTAVAPAQQRRIVRGAEAYLGDNPHLAECDVRFDVMVVRPWRWPLRYKDAWRP